MESVPSAVPGRPRRAGRNATTRVAAPKGAMSGNRTVTVSSPIRSRADRENDGNRFPAAEQVTARYASSPANASEAARAERETRRSAHSERKPETTISERFMLKAR